MAILIVASVATFYLAPRLTTKTITIPETPEIQAIRERYNKQGYMTEEDVKVLNKAGNAHLEQLMREDRERRLNQK